MSPKMGIFNIANGREQNNLTECGNVVRCTDLWSRVMDLDPFDPNTWSAERPGCRIYDVDEERFAVVDEQFFAQLVTMRDTNPGRKGKLLPRRWKINEPHPGRNGRKLYFVSNAGWRRGAGTFLHVEVMRLAGIEPPSPRHRIVGHIDGDEWNCRLSNLEWMTAVKNRRYSKQKY